MLSYCAGKDAVNAHTCQAGAQGLWSGPVANSLPLCMSKTVDVGESIESLLF